MCLSQLSRSRGTDSEKNLIAQLVSRVRLWFKGEPWGLHGFFMFRLACSNLRRENEEIWRCSSLTPSLRRPFKPAIIFLTAYRTACKHAFRFLRVLPEAVSTRHSWLWQTLDDVYTRRCFSESEGTRFGAPGQKALPSVNEFTLLWIFA